MTNSRVVVFDMDDTLYLEREYVRSGFRAVASTAPSQIVPFRRYGLGSRTGCAATPSIVSPKRFPNGGAQVTVSRAGRDLSYASARYSLAAVSACSHRTTAKG